MTSPPEPVSQRLFGVVLFVLILLALALLQQDLSRRAPGKPRIDWPPLSPRKP